VTRAKPLSVDDPRTAANDGGRLSQGDGTNSFDLFHKKLVELVHADVVARRRTPTTDQQID